MRILVAFCTILAFAMPAKAEDPPDIVGDWLCEDQGAAFPEGISGSGYQLDFVVSEQKGPAFRGHVEWTEDRDETPEAKLSIRTIVREDDGSVTFRAPVFGVFGLEPGRFAFTETGDPGYHFGRVIDEATIEFIYLESGEHPLAALRVCQRGG